MSNKKGQAKTLVPFKTSALFCRNCGMLLVVESSSSNITCKFCNNHTDLNCKKPFLNIFKALIGDIVTTSKELTHKKDWIESE